MTHLADVRVVPLPGDGLLWRAPNALLMVLGNATSELSRRLLTEVNMAGAGEDLARSLASVVVSMPRTAVDPFCLLADSEKGLVSMVHGAIHVVSGGETLFDGDRSPTWMDGFIREVDSDIFILPTSAAAAGEAGPWDLAAGLIPAGGVVLTTTPAGLPTPLREEAKTPAPRQPQSAGGQRHKPAGDFELVDLTQADVLASRVSLPLDPDADHWSQGDSVSDPEVVGIQCSREHLNHPDAIFCAHCGIKMVHLTRLPAKGIRPPLGLLVTDEGSTFALDSGYVIGREPEADEAVRLGRARPMVLNDPANNVSRIHAEIRPSGWEVLVLDRSSSNGTFVHQGDGNWVRLGPGETRSLFPGDEISIGERRLAFESNVVPPRNDVRRQPANR